jgi:hypothetical protein
MGMEGAGGTPEGSVPLAASLWMRRVLRYHLRLADGRSVTERWSHHGAPRRTATLTLTHEHTQRNTQRGEGEGAQQRRLLPSNQQGHIEPSLGGRTSGEGVRALSVMYCANAHGTALST